MPTLTIVLPEALAERLRRTVRERYAGKKGAISGVIAEALESYLARASLAAPSEVYRAFRGRRLVAEASSLDELARHLHEKGVNPRDLRIISSKKVAPVARAGSGRERFDRIS